MDLSLVSGATYLRGSKHGDLVKGVVRDDGRIFWAYNRNGGEIWVAPENFHKYAEVANRASAKLDAGKVVDFTRKWRKQNKERARGLSRRQKACDISQDQMKGVMAAFEKMLAGLREGKRVRSKGVSYLKVPITGTEARRLAEYLSCHEEPKRGR